MPGVSDTTEYAAEAETLIQLLDVVGRLRAECLWTSTQTHESLAPYVIEEAHEVREAIASGDDHHLMEELGDLLMQVVLHAAVAHSQARWDISDVARALTEKLIHRNPHVFADAVVTSVDEINANWQRLKSVTQRREHVLDGIPTSLPALMYASKVLARTHDEISGDGIGEQLLRLVAQAREAEVDVEAELLRAAQRHASSSTSIPDR